MTRLFIYRSDQQAILDSEHAIHDTDQQTILDIEHACHDIFNIVKVAQDTENLAIAYSNEHYIITIDEFAAIKSVENATHNTDKYYCLY